MLCRPDHRSRTVRETLQYPEPASFDRPMQQFRLALLDAPNVESDVRDAYDLHEHMTHRGILDAFLLIKTPLDEIALVFEIRSEVLAIYQHLFMDITAFRNKLELRSYALEYPGTDYTKEIVRTAMIAGTDYLLWTYGGGKGPMPQAVIHQVMTDAYYRGMSHRGNAASSTTAKEALRWWSQAVHNAETLEKFNPSNKESAVTDLSIALASRDETMHIDDKQIIRENILH